MTQALMRQVEETSNSSKETRWIRERDLSKCREIVVSFSNAQLGVKLVNARIEGKNKNGCKYAVVLAEVQCNSDAAHVRGVHRPSIDGRSVVTVSTSIVSVLLSLCLCLPRSSVFENTNRTFSRLRHRPKRRARIQQVPVGSYVTRVGKWNAQGATVAVVISKIRGRVSSGCKVEVAFLDYGNS